MPPLSYSEAEPHLYRARDELMKTIAMKASDMEFKTTQPDSLNHRSRLRAALLSWSFVLSLLLTLPLIGISQRPSDAASSSRPNIVFILIDDLRWDELGVVGQRSGFQDNGWKAARRLGKESTADILD